MKVYDYLLTAASEQPDQVAIECMGQKVTYGELTDEARRFGAALRRMGIAPGDGIGLMLPNLPQFVSSVFGSLMNGSIIVPFNVLLQPPEIQYLVQDSGLKLMVVFEMFLPSVLKAIEGLDSPPKLIVIGQSAHGHSLWSEIIDTEERIEPEDVGVDTVIMTIYTSGTTGKPKGALITNGNLATNLEFLGDIFPTEDNERYLCVLPLFHVFALNGVMCAAVKNRATLVLHMKFEPEAAFQSLKNDRITMFPGVPTMYFYLLKHPEAETANFDALKQCISGGAAMPVEVMKQWEETFGVPIYEGFGLTETTVSVCINHPDRPRKFGSVGQPFDGVQMKVVDDDGIEVAHGDSGEVLIKAPNVMKGYLNKPEATAEAIRDGWFYTGDIGYRDEENYFYIVDRKKDMIIKGGYNIYPREIEEVIYQLPDVAEAAVVGIFDEAKGELVRAVIALKPERTLTTDAIREHVEANLAKYKWPEGYLLVADLPKGATGKILKREIRSQWVQWNRDRVNPAEATAGEPAGAGS